MNPQFVYRTETEDDFERVEFLTHEAFWNVYQPGCEEHYILHVLRGTPAVIPKLNLVCEAGGRIVGHIFYTRSRVLSDGGGCFPVITFGPISVHPDMQGRGIGSALIRKTLARAAEMGFSGVVITGNPAYYGRFGFRPASDFGIVYEDGSSFPALMALELTPGGLSGVKGRVSFDPAFTLIDPEELDRFDAQFPHKEKKKLPGQLH